VTGLYYVDLDAVVQHPWTIPSDLLAEHRANLSDVSFGIMDVLRWKVHGSRFYVRDTRRGRDFFAAWFRHRCTFKDQYSLWHTILSMAGREGCIDYEGELYARFTYRMARHAKVHKVPAPLALFYDDVDALNETAPRKGGACAFRSSRAPGAARPRFRAVAGGYG